MQHYYWESEKRHGEADMASDEQAIEAWKSIPGLMVIYKEGENDFVFVWEKKEIE